MSNINIAINKRIVYIKGWFDAGILFVHHLMDNSRIYLIFAIFKQQFPNVRTIFLKYRGVIGAINKYQHQTKVELVANYKVQEPET